MTAGRLKAAADAVASGKSEEQVRIELARRDRAGWFPGTHASGEFGIISGRDGREVARFKVEADRDAVLGLAKLEPAAAKALKLIGDMMPGVRGISLPDYALLNDAPLAVEAALAAVAGRKP